MTISLSEALAPKFDTNCAKSLICLVTTSRSATTARTVER
jgi:hypothetical protein